MTYLCKFDIIVLVLGKLSDLYYITKEKLLMIIPTVVKNWYYTNDEGVRRPLRSLEDAKLAVSAGWPVFGLKEGPGSFNPTSPVVKFLINGKFKCLDGTIYRLM